MFSVKAPGHAQTSKVGLDAAIRRDHHGGLTLRELECEEIVA
ncbi:hypothetical protein [Streptomyces sp. TS71-3]|nr:hypothetical protein [Streptomyces sp. TS71-3]